MSGTAGGTADATLEVVVQLGRYRAWTPPEPPHQDQRKRDAEKQEIKEATAKADRKLRRLNNKIIRDQAKADNKETAERKREEVA